MARGRTLEIGSGTGLNLRHYPEDLDELVLAEPDPGMRSRLQKRLRRSGRAARLVDAPAERLPVADGSVDTAVSTFVLCTVDDPTLALREIARVLRPDGQLLFLEHVRSESPKLARWQDRMVEPWRRFGCGCRCNRATTDVIEASGLMIDEAEPHGTQCRRLCALWSSGARLPPTADTFPARSTRLPLPAQDESSRLTSGRSVFHNPSAGRPRETARLIRALDVY